MTVAETSETSEPAVPLADREAPQRRGTTSERVSLLVLFLGALVFLFPFYYMVVGSLQAVPDTSLAGASRPVG